MKVFIEYDREFIGSTVISSKIRPATEDEIRIAKETYLLKNECDHSVIIDKDCWIYTERRCVVCGKFLGLV